MAENGWLGGCDWSASMNIENIEAGGVFIKATTFEIGEAGHKEVHDYDHLSYLASGKVALWVDGVETTIEGPRAILIEAGKSHRVIAITKASWLCVHSLDRIEKIMGEAECHGQL